MEDGLVHLVRRRHMHQEQQVLILIVMEDGLVLQQSMLYLVRRRRLNPYCNGRWSRTRPYKTILIINKLKNSTKQFFTFPNRKLTFS